MTLIALTEEYLKVCRLQNVWICIVGKDKGYNCAFTFWVMIHTYYQNIHGTHVLYTGIHITIYTVKVCGDALLLCSIAVESKLNVISYFKTTFINLD